MCRAAISVGFVLAITSLAFAEGDFAGTWDTTYGRMKLMQTGDTVSGHYQMGATCSRIEGKVEKNKLTFTYEEPNASGEGWFELSADRKSFAGKWREKGTSEWAPWLGKRVSTSVADTPRGFAGLWRSQFGRIRLVQNGKSMHGCYDYPGGGATISGTVDGKKLTFKYKEPQAEGEGWFELAGDGKSFTGQWRPMGASKWQTWNGSRIEPKPGIVWLVVIEAHWERNIAENEYTFGSMLRAFFSRSPQVQVRHRFFTDEASLRRWCNEIAYLAEPTVLVIASHGSTKGPEADGKTVPAKALGETLRYASNLKLLHFSACEIMRGKAGEELIAAVDKSSRFPVSGYATCVDWAASAIIEFAYCDMVLVRGMSPATAADQIGKLMPFSKDSGVPGSAFGQASFRFLKPGDVK